MISVVLPVYNGEKYVEEAIQSILDQSYKEFELIIVDDCSTDRTPEIIMKYMSLDNRVRTINNKVNCGLPKSLNIGFETCKGEYYTWTSDDNILKENMFERLVYEIENNNADIVFAMCDIIDKDGKYLGESKKYIDLDEIYYENVVRACFLYKREVHIGLNGYDISKFLVEDYDFWLRAYEKFKFCFVPETLYKYRFHSANLSTQRMEEVSLKRIEILKRNFSQTNREDIKNSIMREISNSYYDASNAYYIKLEAKKDKKIIIVSRMKDIAKKIIGR